MRYRDSKTGRFVKRSTWKRSKAQEGTRYKRENPAGKSRLGKLPKKVSRRSVSTDSTTPPISRQGKKRKTSPSRKLSHHKKPLKQMWRATVAAPYYRRTGKKRSSYQSAAFMVRSWFPTKKQAERALPKLIERAESGRAAVVSDPESKAWNNNRAETNTEIRSVDFDARLLDTIEDDNEDPTLR